jgi:serine/threonine protein phosphatase PrpC
MLTNTKGLTSGRRDFHVPYAPLMTHPAVRADVGSVIGSRYRTNFDVAHLSEHPLIAVVADGMGDGAGSTMAGRTAVGILVERVGAGTVDPNTLRSAVAEAQEKVGDFGKRVGVLAGCTLTALVDSELGTWLVQIGDSRAYRLRDGLLELLTVDHTEAWLGAINGWYAADSPEAAGARYHLTRFVGHPARPEPDVMSLALRPGDVLLLCTDGIAEQVLYQHIHNTLARPTTPGDQVRELLSLAEAAGGRDNATAIVVQVGS